MRATWLFVRWVVPLGLGLLLSTAWGALLLASGSAQVSAWYLVHVVSWVATLALVLVGSYALVRKRRSTPVLVSLGLALAGAWPIAWNIDLLVVPFPRSLASAPSMAVRLPLDVPVRAFWGGDQLTGNYHRSSPDQTWAYDLVVEPAGTQARRNEDYGCWGLPVVAPARGVVAVAEDGRDDQPPGAALEPEHPAGNHVFLDLDGGFLLLAHLARGSVLVKAGDTVEEGQPLGRCGNSGNSSEPHVHLHLQRQDPRRLPFGFAEGLPLFFRDNDGPAMPGGGFTATADGGLVLLSPVLLHHGRSEVRVLRAGVDVPDAFCSDFRLTADQVQSFFTRATVMTARQLHDDFEWLPCFVEGELVEGTTTRRWRIRPTGIAEVAGPGDAGVLYGCRACDDLFR